jgi:hypothetical protein
VLVDGRDAMETLDDFLEAQAQLIFIFEEF